MVLLQFALAVYQRTAGTHVVPVASYLVERAQGTATWVPDLEDSTLIFTVGQRQLIAPYWNLGPVRWLLPQLEAGAERLARNEPALIRSAVIEGSEVPYLLLEPQGSQVEAALFIIPDPAIERIFPAGPWSQESPLLYAFVAQHRQELLHPNIDPSILQALGDEYFSEVSVERAALIDGVRQATRDGRALIEALEA